MSSVGSSVVGYLYTDAFCDLQIAFWTAARVVISTGMGQGSGLQILKIKKNQLQLICTVRFIKDLAFNMSRSVRESDLESMRPGTIAKEMYTLTQTPGETPTWGST